MVKRDSGIRNSRSNEAHGGIVRNNEDRERRGRGMHNAAKKLQVRSRQ